jgi:hypothetical protein
VLFGNAFRRPGSDLLSRVLRRSTIGAEGFHGRVRDGIGCVAPRCGHQAIETPPKDIGAADVLEPVGSLRLAKSGRATGLMRRVGMGVVWGRCLLLTDVVVHGFAVFAAVRDGFCFRSLVAREDEPIERLGPVSFTHCCASTPGLSTWWSTTALRRDLVLREASRLDAFSGYPVRT